MRIPAIHLDERQNRSVFPEESRMKAVRFDRYGGLEVLEIADVPMPEPSHGEVLVKVKAASINPGEAKIREGVYHAMWPATFPSGEGTDFAGIVMKVGPGTEGVAAGDEVIGFTGQRASHAEYIVVARTSLTAKPAGVSWEVAGSLAVAGSTAQASVSAVSLKAGETVVVSAAAGGVGSIAVQLAKRTGATVIGIASPANHAWLVSHGVRPETYGPDLADRLRDIKVDALIDANGNGYVELAVKLGVSPGRINTIIDFEAAREYGAKTDGGTAVLTASLLAELAALVAAGELEIPIAATFPLDQVRAAFTQLAQGHIRGKIVLLP
jgi:NADPH:quinone reductase-like Zn-dependent oxidoreductase